MELSIASRLPSMLSILVISACSVVSPSTHWTGLATGLSKDHRPLTPILTVLYRHAPVQRTMRPDSPDSVGAMQSKVSRMPNAKRCPYRQSASDKQIAEWTACGSVARRHRPSPVTCEAHRGKPVFAGSCPKSSERKPSFGLSSGRYRDQPSSVPRPTHPFTLSPARHPNVSSHALGTHGLVFFAKLDSRRSYQHHRSTSFVYTRHVRRIKHPVAGRGGRFRGSLSRREC